MASQHNKVGNILCQQLATFNWLQHQFLAKKKVSQLCHRMLISQSFNFPIFSGEHAHKHFWGVCCKATCLTGWFQNEKERIPDVHHRHFYHIKQFTSCFVPLENTLFNFSNISILRQHFKLKVPFSNCPPLSKKIQKEKQNNKHLSLLATCCLSCFKGFKLSLQASRYK